VNEEYADYSIASHGLKVLGVTVLLGVAGAIYTARLNTMDLGRPAPENLYAPHVREIGDGWVNTGPAGHMVMWKNFKIDAGRSGGAGKLRISSALNSGITFLSLVQGDQQTSSSILDVSTQARVVDPHERMRILYDGNVLIGGTTEKTALAVIDPGGKVTYVRANQDETVRYLVGVIKELSGQMCR
jgi:hypothetical protein